MSNWKDSIKKAYSEDDFLHDKVSSLKVKSRMPKIISAIKEVLIDLEKGRPETDPILRINNPISIMENFLKDAEKVLKKLEKELK